MNIKINPSTNTLVFLEDLNPNNINDAVELIRKFSNYRIILNRTGYGETSPLKDNGWKGDGATKSIRTPSQLENDLARYIKERADKSKKELEESWKRPPFYKDSQLDTYKTVLGNFHNYSFPNEPSFWDQPMRGPETVKTEM